MHRSGIPTLVYSPQLGRVAEDFAEQGVQVTSDVSQVAAFEPNILHVHHFEDTGKALSVIGSECRTVNMIHGLLPHPEWPGQGMDRYLASSIHAKAKAVLLGEVRWHDVALTPNFFDPKRFRQDATGERTGALLHSSRANVDDVSRLGLVLASQGLNLDQIGYGARVVRRPETLLPKYDVVFAVGRSAIEALACGCRVILWDHGVIGPLITPENFWFSVASNFSLAAGVLPFAFADDSRAEDWLDEQLGIECDTEYLQKLVNHVLSVDSIGGRMIGLYASLSQF